MAIKKISEFDEMTFVQDSDEILVERNGVGKSVKSVKLKNYVEKIFPINISGEKKSTEGSIFDELSLNGATLAYDVCKDSYWYFKRLNFDKVRIGYNNNYYYKANNPHLFQVQYANNYVFIVGMARGADKYDFALMINERNVVGVFYNHEMINMTEADFNVSFVIDYTSESHHNYSRSERLGLEPILTTSQLPITRRLGSGFNEKLKYCFLGDKSYRFYIPKTNVSSYFLVRFTSLLEYQYIKGRKYQIILQSSSDIDKVFTLVSLNEWGSHDKPATKKYINLKANKVMVLENEIPLEHEGFSDTTKISFVLGRDKLIMPDDFTLDVRYAWVNDSIFKNDIVNNALKAHVAENLKNFDKDDYYTKEEINELIDITPDSDYIVCWGDSLTAGEGWTTRLQELSGMTVYNAGTGGEGARTIMARQGGDIMVVNNITIPAGLEPVLISDRDVDTGIDTEEGKKATPLLQGGTAHVNPCKIGDIEGTLKWTGSSYSDMTGTWTFTRSVAGDSVEITRPTAIRTAFDMNRNSPYLMVIFIGQNGWGSSDVNLLIEMHKKMIAHANAKHVIILGLSSGTAESRASYEEAMKKEFGRYFISLREYLSHPIYDTTGETIISCYGLDDSDITPTDDDLQKIAIGQVPSSLLSDTVHYTTTTKTVIGNMIYRRCRDLNIF